MSGEHPALPTPNPLVPSCFWSMGVLNRVSWRCSVPRAWPQEVVREKGEVTSQHDDAGEDDENHLRRRPDDPFWILLASVGCYTQDCPFVQVGTYLLEPVSGPLTRSRPFGRLAHSLLCLFRSASAGNHAANGLKSKDQMRGGCWLKRQRETCARWPFAVIELKAAWLPPRNQETPRGMLAEGIE